MSTCRHEWLMGSDACMHCGESWAALYSGEGVTVGQVWSDGMVERTRTLREGVVSIYRELLGCQWGRVVWTPDDQLECDGKAERIFVLHDGDAEITLKLCGRHVERLSLETVRREFPQTRQAVAGQEDDLP